jgi:G:T-mismatch repair DNA endonuclease (very short patch repair protein)
MARHYTIRNPEEFSKHRSEAIKKLISEGRWFTETHCNALSKARRNRVIPPTSILARRRMSLSHKVRCSAPNVRAKMSINAKLLWQNPEYREKVIKAAAEGQRRRWAELDERAKSRVVRSLRLSQRVKPNKLEVLLQNLLNNNFPNEWRYVGNGEVVMGCKNPDFINVNGKKQIIELFGDYWHGEDRTGNSAEKEIESRESIYKQYGYDTIVVWEHELSDELYIINKIKDVFYAVKEF